MSQANFTDPRSKISHTIDEGQVYEDARTGDEMRLVFLSEDAALLRESENVHRLEGRAQFEANVGSDRYTLQGTADTAANSKVAKIEQLIFKYEQEDGRTAAHKVEALEEARELIEHNGRPDDNEAVELTEIYGIGSKAASALRANGFSTKGDVRGADSEEIESVPHMGAKNTAALIEHVED